MTDRKQEADDCAFWIGRALSEWSLVEHGIFRIFELALDLSKAAHPVFWEAHSATARLQTTNLAMRARFKGFSALLENWDKLRKRVIGANGIRNQIAHGTIVGIQGKKGARVRLIPFLFSDMDKINMGEFETGLTLENIEAAAREFKEIDKAISAFTIEVLEHLDKKKPA